MKRVVIVGGGYAGTNLASVLDRNFEVVLVEPREAFVHNVAAIRATVAPELTDQIILPFDRLLSRGRVVRDRATSASDGAVTLASGGTLVGDYIVLATGSTYAPPFKPTSDAIAEFRTAARASADEIALAKSIVVVGAGAVGVELAGEIAATYPDKRLTLISSTSTLFPDFPAGLGKRLMSELRRLGVRLRLGVTAHLKSSDRFQPGPLRLDAGEVIEADLIIPALGARPSTAILAGQANIGFDRIGRVAVDGWMRPPGLNRVFALGDMAANGDLMTIVGSSRQVTWLAKTLSALASGSELTSLPAYTPWAAPPILIPLGSKRGASVLPITSEGMVVGPLLTRALKGKSLFIPRYRKAFGLTGQT